jgi:hypothetical protein
MRRCELKRPYANYFWSVAVVAPVHEIEGSISLVYEDRFSCSR